jgi:Na+/H+-dicarboxylate symporter
MLNLKNAIHPIESIHPRSLKFLNEKLHSLVKGRLWLKVLIGLVLGILVGLLLGPEANLVSQPTSSAIGEWLALPGIIFLKVIQMIVIPLIFASIIRGIAASENIRQLKKTGLFVGAYFLITTIVAIIIGIFLATFIEPGQYVQKNFADLSGGDIGEVEAGKFSPVSAKDIPNLIGALLPANILGSIINGQMLQIVIFSIIFGIALVSMNINQSRPLLELLGSVQSVCMTIVKWTMVLAPFAVFGLMAKLMSQFGLDTLFGIGIYVLTVLSGLAVIMLLNFMVVFYSVKLSPFNFLKRTRDVLLLAFSTSSSAAVMPLSIKTAEEKLNVRPSISQFVIPIGATINMNGTALYQSVATIFLAQVFGIELNLTILLVLIVTIVGASIGSPAAPGVGIAILAIILEGVGIPLVGLALILGVDRILDMSRTSINVLGDLTACTLVNKLVKSEKTTNQLLKEEAMREQKREILKQDIIVSKPTRN